MTDLCDILGYAKSFAVVAGNPNNPSSGLFTRDYSDTETFNGNVAILNKFQMGFMAPFTVYNGLLYQHPIGVLPEAVKARNSVMQALQTLWSQPITGAPLPNLWEKWLITPGVYTVAKPEPTIIKGSNQLIGDGVFIFLMPHGFTMTGGQDNPFLLVDGAQADNVYLVGTDAFGTMGSVSLQNDVPGTVFGRHVETVAPDNLVFGRIFATETLVTDNITKVYIHNMCPQ